MSMTKSMLSELPETVIPEAISVIDKINGTNIPEDCDAFAETIDKALREKWGKEYRREAKRLGIDTQEGLRLTVDIYITLRKEYPNIAFHNDYVMRSGTTVSDTALFLIDVAVREKKITDRFDIVSEVSNMLEARFGDTDKLEVNLEKLNMRTTKDILHAIDLYFIMRELYPDTVFGRDRMRKAWKCAI